jgi:N-acetylmuramoyl-L-alanine amidase
LTGCVEHPSPNQGARRGGRRPDMILIHYTAMARTEDALRRLCDPASEVSSHYLIGRDGHVWRLVAEARRAWHAGAGEWGGEGDVNSRSIGIELSSDGFEPFPEPQMATLERLLDSIRARWPQIAPERVLGHSDTAPGRKIDPGPRFDWLRLARAGRAIWPAPADPVPRNDFLRAGHRAGYTACENDEMLATALRLRFRPGASGPVDAADLAIAADLARRFPVDPAPASA